ncbi:MAG: hypothetical protein JKY34_07340 [Kordiimonadaceae bacterium]|nr:hypothetical protein [Kordiimonadaceae bacterium]
MLNRTKYGVDVDGFNDAPLSDDTAFLDEVKDFIQVDYAGDDTLIYKLYLTALAYLDGNAGIANRSLIYSVWDYTLACFPCDEITLPLSPTVKVLAVSYRDTDGNTQQLVEGTDCRVNRLGAQNHRAQIVPLTSWPSVERGGDAVTISYVAGYSQTPSGLPETVKTVIKCLVAEWHTNRTPNGAIPESPAFTGLLSSIRFTEI